MASAAGIIPISRPSGRQSPASASSAPQTANAPTAAGQPPSMAPADASSAAPGVDHAIVAGIRVPAASQTVSTPMPIETRQQPRGRLRVAGADRGQGP